MFLRQGDTDAPLHVAQVIKPWGEFPAAKYGAIQKLVPWIVDMMPDYVRTTIYAPGSQTEWRYSDQTVSLFPDAMGGKGYSRVLESAQALHMFKDFPSRIADYETGVIHMHSLYPGLAAAALSPYPIVFTVHDTPVLESVTMMELCADLPHVHFAFVSQNQKSLYPAISNGSVIYNGIDIDTFPLVPASGKEDYFAYIGAISPIKGVHYAIEAALKAQVQLIIAGNVRDREYFNQVIMPMINQSSGMVQYIGEINDQQRNCLFGHARAFLFPVSYEDSLPTVTLESLAVGTPVIAFNKGSLREMVTTGLNGFIVESVDEMVQAISTVGSISPEICRRTVEERFTFQRMGIDYYNLYQRLADAVAPRLINSGLPYLHAAREVNR